MTRGTRPRSPRPRPRPGQVTILMALLSAGFVQTSVTAAQELLTARDVTAAPWPEADARIAYGDDPLQFGYLRLPGGDGPHPVVVFVHGGCYLSQFDIGHAGPAEEALANAGYAVWSVEYRRVGDPGGGWPNTFRDVAAGIDHLRELAREHQLDLERVYAVGHSAGANMVLWAAARARIPEASVLHDPDPLPLQGVLGLAPAANIEDLHRENVCGGVIERLYGGSPTSHPDRYAVTSPMQLMPMDVPQRLIVGAHDASWGPSGRAYFEAARAAGAPVTMTVAPESGHFEVIAPSTSTWALVLDELRHLVEPR